METSLPDLPFNARCIITADTHSASYSTCHAYPRTDLKQFEPWVTFPTDIHAVICDAMMRMGIANGKNIVVGENLRRRPRLVACEGDVHEVANTELHQAAVDALSELGVQGRFCRPGSGQIGIIGDGDFAWLGSFMSHPLLVAEYKPDWVADLLDLDANLEAVAGDTSTVNDRQCVDALQQIYGYMTFNGNKYGILSNLHRTWFFERVEGRGILNYAGPIDLNNPVPSSGLSILKALVGVVLLAEKNPFHASPIVDRVPPGRLFSSTGITDAESYLAPTLNGAYKCLDLDPRLCDFQHSTARHTMRGFVVETNLLHFRSKRNLTAICKAVDLFQNQTAIAALEAESLTYLALRHLQGRCIPKVYGYFSVWGILRFLALENVGEAISESMPISSALRRKMKVAIQHIHDAGYVHGDIERRNFCVKGGIVFVIDLEYCQRTQDYTRMNAEMAAVDAL